MAEVVVEFTGPVLVGNGDTSPLVDPPAWPESVVVGTEPQWEDASDTSYAHTRVKMESVPFFYAADVMGVRIVSPLVFTSVEKIEFEFRGYTETDDVAQEDAIEVNFYLSPDGSIVSGAMVASTFGLNPTGVNNTIGTWVGDSVALSAPDEAAFSDLVTGLLAQSEMYVLLFVGVSVTADFFYDLRVHELSVTITGELAPEGDDPFWRNLAINPSGEQGYNTAWGASNGTVQTNVEWMV